jgi:hypothetical protein
MRLDINSNKVKMLTCTDCKRCKDISTHPYTIKLYCTIAKAEITESSPVMIFGADECLDFQQISSLTYLLRIENIEIRKILYNGY